MTLTRTRVAALAAVAVAALVALATTDVATLDAAIAGVNWR